jgi:hypothetical protein
VLLRTYDRSGLFSVADDDQLNRQATDEVVARLNKHWDDDVRAFDAVYDHILHMSDALSDGIVKQFPEKFAAGVVSTTGKK